MADTKLTALAAITTPVALDEFYVVVDTDSTPVSKKIAYSDLVAGLTTTAANTSLVDTDLVVAPFTNVQDFADGIDAAVLRARGTGVSSSYVSTVAVGGTTFAQPAVSGEISSDEGYFSISYAGATGITVTTLSSPSTYVYIDNAGALQQQVTEPTRQDWSRKMFTMRIAVDAVAETILGFEYLNNPIGHYANSIRDLYTALLAQGVPFKVGQTITGRATDLGFDASAGTIMEFGGTGDINNSNLLDISAVTNATYDLLTRTTIAASAQTDLVKFWDNAGTITALGSTTVVGHRLYRFSNGQFAMQYGQGNYANISLARAGVLLEDYVLNPRLVNATFFGWWLIQETATNTGGTTLTDFREYTIGVQGGSSSGLSGCLLQGNNLSDLENAATARTNLGVITDHALLSNLAWTSSGHTGTPNRFLAFGGSGQTVEVSPTGNDTRIVTGTAGTGGNLAEWDASGNVIGTSTTVAKLRTQSIITACSDEATALTTGTAKVTFRMPYAFTLTGVRASVATAPTGSVITVDINEAGVTILSTKITIDAGEKTSTTAAVAPVISDSSLADDAEITVDIDAIGSSVAGAGLKVALLGYTT